MNLTKVEADFREWAFYRYFWKVYHDVRDPWERFAKSLVSSLEPIKDRQALIDWGTLNKRRPTCDELDQMARESLARQGRRLARGGVE